MKVKNIMAYKMYLPDKILLNSYFYLYEEQHLIYIKLPLHLHKARIFG